MHSICPRKSEFLCCNWEISTRPKYIQYGGALNLHKKITSNPIILTFLMFLVILLYSFLFTTNTLIFKVAAVLLNGPFVQEANTANASSLMQTKWQLLRCYYYLLNHKHELLPLFELQK